MAEQTEPQTRFPDVLDLWRQWLTETERQWNAFFNNMMGTDTYSQGLGQFMEGYTTFQSLVAQNIERYFSLFNLPTRNDLVRIGEQLSGIEERLAAIEERLENAAASGNGAIPASPRSNPKRTRRPPSLPTDGAGA